MTTLPQTLAALCSTNAVQAEVIAQLRAVLAPPTDFAAVAHFSPQESIILSTILRWDTASFEQISQALYGLRRNDWPGGNVVDVLVHRIRRKLDLHGISFRNIYGRGYRMAPECKAKLRQIMAGVRV